jgi:N,N-dimethylformamidase
MKVVGYGDRLSVAAGERIEFKVSCEEGSYEAALVQPSHSEELYGEIDAPLNGSHPGRVQAFPKGSYVQIGRPVPRPETLRIELWAFATAPGRGEQGLLTWEDGDGLFLTGDGRLELRSAGERLTAEVPLRERQWYRVNAVIEPEGASLSQVPLRWSGEDHVHGSLPANPGEGDLRIGEGFDGKLDSPRIEGVAAWDFSLGIQTTRVHDTGPLGLHGETVNMPTRGVTGWNWNGDHVDYKAAPQHYGAIHFHTDDLEDAAWETDFHLDVPADLESGLYTIRLRAGGEEDHVPFFVRRADGASRAKIAFLAPTFSYLAYSCETSGTKASGGIPEEERRRKEEALAPGDHYAADHELRSLYDLHNDGSGVCFVSRLRPLPNMRPFYISPPIDGPHQLGADLYVLDWLRGLGEEFEVLTDEDLHDGGIDAIEPYRVVITGTHPEYWSEPMLDAVDRFMGEGGRFMYLGGNGMYWVTDPHPERPHMVEVRRTHAGSRAWQSEPGECYQQTTGAPSGLWRFRGRPPHAAYGVGMAAHGHDIAIPYERTPESFDPAVAWIFEGVGDDEPIGDFGACMGGAGGFEIDSFDHAQGTPPATVLLATATGGFTDTYNGVVENVLMEGSEAKASTNPAVRADMTYLSYPNGGAVFSTGSVCWGTSLTHEGGDNNVARITGNVLRRFVADR